METNNKKTFWLTNFALSNKTSVILIAIILSLLGILTYSGLPRESFPEIQSNQLYISTPYPGNSPRNVENLITRYIEKYLKKEKGIQEIRSVSVQDYSAIVVEFKTSVEKSVARTRTKNAIDNAKKDLPTDLDEDPVIAEIDPSQIPIININMSGNYSFNEFKYYANKLKDEIERVPEVSEVIIGGLDDKEVEILVDPIKMENRNVNFNSIANAVKSENITISGGDIKENLVNRTITIDGEIKDPNLIKDLIVKNEHGNSVYLSDIAEVKYDFVDKESYSRLNGLNVSSLMVKKRSGENMIAAIEKIDKQISIAKKDLLPKDMIITYSNDQSKETKNMVSNLENSIVLGVLLVVGVLLFFLNTRNSLFVGMAIPLSMFLTFVGVSAIGYTLNMMVLFSLIIALGLLVDNGIVIVENVYRYYSNGNSLEDSAKYGVGEVALPIITSTLTTLLAFMPLIFWEGIIGEFMKIMPITLIITLSSSLFVALFINPVIMSKFMKLDKGYEKPSRKKIFIYSIVFFIGLMFALLGMITFGNLIMIFVILALLDILVLSKGARYFQNILLPKIETFYSKIISWSLKKKNPYKVFFGTISMLIISVVMLSIFTPKVLFFPEQDPKMIHVFIEMPIGTKIQETNRVTEGIEKQLNKITKDYKHIIKSMISNVGKETGDPGDPSAISTATETHSARITLDFVEFKDRNGLNTMNLLNKIRKELVIEPGVYVSVDQNAVGPPTGKPISIEIYGYELDELMTEADKIKKYLESKQIFGIENLKSNLSLVKPELKIDVNREIAKKLGVSTSQIANEIRTSVYGTEISKYKEGKEDYKINIRLKESYRNDINQLMTKKISFKNQNNGKDIQVPLSSVVNYSFASTFNSIDRKDERRVVTLSSNLIKGANGTEVNNKIVESLNEYNFKKGITFKLGGEQEKQKKEMDFLLKAFVFALLLIFLVIVSQFNSLSSSIIIIFSVIFSTIGVFIGLAITQSDFVIIMSMLGLISLAGIVVNNAIVLIDFIKLNEKNIRNKNNGNITIEELIQILIEAGRTRLRPVLLTAITTVLGLLPLATGTNIDFINLISEYNANIYFGGDNSAFWGPMSWTVIHGLVFSTILTLVVVPVMYLLIAKTKRKLKREYN